MPAHELTILRVPPSKHRPRDVRSVAMAPCAALDAGRSGGRVSILSFGMPSSREPVRHGRDNIHRLALYCILLSMNVLWMHGPSVLSRQSALCRHEVKSQ